ncbi:MAG: radical SAM protein [Candidatus Aenigmarchaeota archaeon]|nr:radical SAM protein [Candidatus Aenigmarchaeota archaeon]
MAGRKKATSSGEGKPIAKTTSVCPECNLIIGAEIFERDGKVFIMKQCPEHGAFEEIYWSSVDMYNKAHSFAKDGHGIDNPNIDKDNPVCPRDCGLCSMHKSHTALANLVLTNRCDLSCWYCFFYAKRLGYVYEPTKKELNDMVKTLVNEKPVACNAIQLTGGEPTLREDLVDIISMCKGHGVDHVQLNTNGIRLSHDLDLMRRAREAGVNTLYLSFDGVTPKTNPKNHWEIPGVLQNCRTAGGVGVVLVPTLVKSVNDHEVGDMLRFGFRNLDVVRGVNFQPVSLVGRITRAKREKMRITIPDAIQKIEEQTDGQIAKEDFYPVPTPHPITRFVEALTGKATYDLTSHFACGMATYVFENDGGMLPLPRFIDVEGLLEYLNGQAEELEKGKSRYVVGAKLLFKLRSFVDKGKAPKGFSVAKLIYNVLMKHDYTALGELQHRSLFVGMMHFMDKYNYDIERVKRCCIHYVMSDNRIVPFCAFNVIPEWYRDKDQEEQGLSFKEYERKTGRKLERDAYKRDIKALSSSEIYRKTYG